MKIYLFNPENGLYLGEDFADEAPRVGLGDYKLPDDATIVPPPRIENGQILVFNVSAQQWEVRTGKGG